VLYFRNAIHRNVKKVKICPRTGHEGPEDE